MPEQTIGLPFKMPDLYSGMADGKGLAKATPSELVLELVIKDSVLGVFQSNVKEIHIPRDEVEFARLARGWFATKVHIRVKSMKWLADLPGCDSADFTLHVARRDREQAV